MENFSLQAVNFGDHGHAAGDGQLWSWGRVGAAVDWLGREDCDEVAWATWLQPIILDPQKQQHLTVRSLSG